MKSGHSNLSTQPLQSFHIQLSTWHKHTGTIWNWKPDARGDPEKDLLAALPCLVVDRWRPITQDSRHGQVDVYENGMMLKVCSLSPMLGDKKEDSQDIASNFKPILFHVLAVKRAWFKEFSWVVSPWQTLISLWLILICVIHAARITSCPRSEGVRMSRTVVTLNVLWRVSKCYSTLRH